MEIFGGQQPRIVRLESRAKARSSQCSSPASGVLDAIDDTEATAGKTSAVTVIAKCSVRFSWGRHRFDILDGANDARNSLADCRENEYLWLGSSIDTVPSSIDKFGIAIVSPLRAA